MNEKVRGLEQLFANIHILLAHLDRDFNFVRVNAAYAAADGRDPGFFPGRNHFSLYPNAENEAIFRGVVESGLPYTAFARPFIYAEHPERGTSYWDWSLIPIKGTGGSVEMLILALIDVTERVVSAHRLQAAMEYQRNLVETSPSPLVIVDPDGRIHDVNSAAERTFGCTRDDLIGTEYAAHCVDPEAAHACARQVSHEGAVNDCGLDLRRGDGSIVSVLCNAATHRDPDGQVSGLIISYCDVTKRLRAERERDTLEQQLQDRLVELARQAGQMHRAEELARLGYWREELATGRLTWSPGAFRLLGFDPESLIPTRAEFLQRIHPDDRQRVATAKTNAVAQRCTFEEEFRVLRANDGEERILHTKAEIETDANGNPISLFGATLDVTESRHAEAMLRERFLLMAENIRDVFWVRDPTTGAVVYINLAYERIWGRSRSGLYAHPEGYFEAIHPDDRPQVAGGFAAFSTGEWAAEYRVVRPDGTLRWVADHGFVLADTAGGGHLLVGTAADVTALKAAAIELRAKNLKLEMTNRELQEFAYAASHDLKAPLRAIHGLASLLEEELQGRLSGDGHHHLQLLRDRARHMDDLINGLLDYSRAGGGAGATETASVADMVEEIARNHEVPDGPRVSADAGLPVLHTDRLHLYQVLDNLIGNAVKYHDRPGGRVHVSATDLGTCHEFVVADDGPGIPPAYQQRIFDIFQRGPVGGPDGTGIGLAIVKKVVQHAGGQVHLESTPGHGSVFRFTWPKQADGPPPAEH